MFYEDEDFDPLLILQPRAQLPPPPGGGFFLLTTGGGLNLADNVSYLKLAGE